MNDCQHRDKRLVVSLPAYTYQVQCSACMLTGDAERSGMQAYIAWLRLMRVEAQEQAAAA